MKSSIINYFTKLFGSVTNMPKDGALLGTSTDGGVKFSRIKPIVTLRLVETDAQIVTAKAKPDPFIDIRNGRLYEKVGTTWKDAHYGGGRDLLQPSTLIYEADGKGVYYCDNFMRYYKVNLTTGTVQQ